LISFNNSYSTLPIIHVILVVGQWLWIVLITGNVWQISPIADNRKIQICFGGRLKSNMAGFW
ncbi:MAG: hypothetical protein KAI84_07110, partial [Gammaproteobacteria bacterium]|nr:hypothetical protein [Gammaproteobacteria bacterium]